MRWRNGPTPDRTDIWCGMRKALIEPLKQLGCRWIKRRGQSPLWENAAGTKRASFPRRPEPAGGRRLPGVPAAQCATPCMAGQVAGDQTEAELDAGEIRRSDTIRNDLPNE